MVTYFDACEILEMLSEASVKVFLDGGWGVDDGLFAGSALDVLKVGGIVHELGHGLYLAEKLEFKCKSRGMGACLHSRDAALNARKTGI